MVEKIEILGIGGKGSGQTNEGGLLVEVWKYWGEKNPKKKRKRGKNWG